MVINISDLLAEMYLHLGLDEALLSFRGHHGFRSRIHLPHDKFTVMLFSLINVPE